MLQAWPDESELLTPDPATATTAPTAPTSMTAVSSTTAPVEAPVEQAAEQATEQAAEGTEPSHCAAMPMSDAEVSAAKGFGEAGTVDL